MKEKQEKTPLDFQFLATAQLVRNVKLKWTRNTSAELRWSSDSLHPQGQQWEQAAAAPRPSPSPTRLRLTATTNRSPPTSPPTQLRGRGCS